MSSWRTQRGSAGVIAALGILALAILLVGLGLLFVSAEVRDEQHTGPTEDVGDQSPGGTSSAPAPSAPQSGSQPSLMAPFQQAELPAADPPETVQGGDVIVIGLDGRKLRQPASSPIPFWIPKPGEANDQGLPAGVSEDGKWIYYNIPTRVRLADGTEILRLNTYEARPFKGPVVDREKDGEKR